MSLSSCGSGSSGSTGSNTTIDPTSGSSGSEVTIARPTSSDASRFLAQATFGATDADIAAVLSSDYSSWINSQISMPVTESHLGYMDGRLTALRAQDKNATIGQSQFYESFWIQAATEKDQLRQRVKFALSEIFVTSFSNKNVSARGMGSYYDMLGRDAFGNYRNILTDVTYHAAMGSFLTYIANQKEDLKTGRVPDENYARELMQLMTIGLWELNLDGTRKSDAFGNPIPTYTPDDIKGLAKVFTGLSWYSASPNITTFKGGNRDIEAFTRPMLAYNDYHSTSEKRFLGTTLYATSAADANADVKAALDVLFMHPNVGPFVSKQLIQRLVTSNPSPAYVRRVALIFNNNGSGVRGDMAAVVKAILLDPEARSRTVDSSYGKLREPVVRLANWMRSFEVTSKSGVWLMTSTAGRTSLAQAPLGSPSVFNFFRPGYTPATARLGGSNKMAPEFQITDEVTTATYLNLMQRIVANGVGGPAGGDITSTYSKELALANDPTALVDRVDLLLGVGMSTTLKAKIINAVSSVPIPAAGNQQSAIDTAKLNRVRLAVFLSMASPEYLAQR